MKNLVTLSEKQNQLVEDLLIIPDEQERLATVVARSKSISMLAPEERTDTNRVQGCVSAVWLVVEKDIATHRLRLRMDADSPLVKSLVALICALYEDSVVSDAATFHAELLERLNIAQNLSPTRRNGLAAVCARIRVRASQLADNDSTQSA